MSVRQSILAAGQVLAVNFTPLLFVRFQSDKPGDRKRIILYFSNLLAIRLRCYSIKDFVGEVFWPRSMIPFKEFRQPTANLFVLLPCSRRIRIKTQKQSG